MSQTFSSLRVFESQILIVPSYEQDAIRFYSPLKYSRSKIVSEWPDCVMNSDVSV